MLDINMEVISKTREIVNSKLVNKLLVQWGVKKKGV